MFGPGDDSTDRPDELKEQIDGVVCWWEIFMCQIFAVFIRCGTRKVGGSEV